MYLKIVFYLILAAISIGLRAQSDPPKRSEEKLLDMNDVQVMPEFPGGETALKQFISDKLQYPATAQEYGIKGTVLIRFVIDAEGNILEPKLVKDIGGGCGKESLRLVSLMPKWKPGETDGHPVKVQYTLPVRFSLDNNAPNDQAASDGRQEFSREKTWELVAQAAKNLGQLKTLPTPETPFDLKNTKDQKLLSGLELAFKTLFSEADKAKFTQLSQVSEYVYLSQFAPVFFSVSQYRGQFVKLLTDRADFDANADGLGKIGALKAPKGIRLVLYSKKNFKGKKLEIDATEAEVNIEDMNALPAEQQHIKDHGKGINWALGTKSLKIKLPKKFPE